MDEASSSLFEYPVPTTIYAYTSKGFESALPKDANNVAYNPAERTLRAIQESGRFDDQNVQFKYIDVDKQSIDNVNFQDGNHIAFGFDPNLKDRNLDKPYLREEAYSSNTLFDKDNKINQMINPKLPQDSYYPSTGVISDPNATNVLNQNGTFEKGSLDSCGQYYCGYINSNLAQLNPDRNRATFGHLGDFKDLDAQAKFTGDYIEQNMNHNLPTLQNAFQGSAQNPTNIQP